MLVQGIHHVCIRCEKSEIEEVKEFYQGVLGMPVIRSWGEPELEGFMFDTGAGWWKSLPMPRDSCRREASGILH